MLISFLNQFKKPRMKFKSLLSLKNILLIEPTSKKKRLSTIILNLLKFDIQNFVGVIIKQSKLKRFGDAWSRDMK